jgi:hypothetical protein
LAPSQLESAKPCPNVSSSNGPPSAGLAVIK